MNAHDDKPGLQHGCLAATMLPLVHFGLFAGIGWASRPGAWPSTVSGWLGLLAGSVGLVIAYLLSLLLLAPVLLVLSFKDRDAIGFVRNNWPLLLAFSYPLWGGWVIPGPFDEAVVLGLGGVLWVWFRAQRYRLATRHSRGLGDDEKRQLLQEARVATPELPAGGLRELGQGRGDPPAA